MRIHLITGGVRSGKSRHAEVVARSLGGELVTYVATAQVNDEEMRRRVQRHRAERPPTWITHEAPDDADEAVRESGTQVVLLDCLTVFLANALGRAHPVDEPTALGAMELAASQLLAAAAGRDGDLIVVSNEVGSGVHPETAVGRWFRDGLGMANQRFAAVAQEVILCVAGVPLPLKRWPSSWA